MRLRQVLALAVLLASTATAQLTSVLAELPNCALDCMLPAVEASPCGFTNQTCLCTNEPLNANISACVMVKCTVKEALSTKNLTSSACHAPIRDRTPVIYISGPVGLGVTLLVFAGRMIARLPSLGGSFGMDDWTMLLTILLTIPLGSLSVLLGKLGLGKDMWTVPFDNITQILFIYFWDELLYVAILPMTKISILCFYLRVFPNPKFRVATYIVIALNIAYLIAFEVVSIIQCRPLDGAWLRWYQEENFQCHNINAQGWSAAAGNMFLDVLTMILPLGEITSLGLSLKKKFFVMLMFSLGIFVTLVSILRLKSLVQFASTTNLTWDYVDIGYWSVIEVYVGIICACLPAVRSLLRRLFPKAWGTTYNHTNDGSKWSKMSGSRSRSNTGSRLDQVAMSQKPKQDESDFVPLEEMGTRRNANHAPTHAYAY